ncbi:MAG: FRG domain-containing protein [Phycisphaerales bacterium]|nr:MAG: FRG domain-containing protein [Phycisphaerales bacterium]
MEDLESKRETGKHFSPALFRGQGKASDELKTTLERYSIGQYSPEDYYDVMRVVRPAVESCTEKRWDIADQYARNDSVRGAPQGYEFMAYLRHHDFPSPLLDWTRSFYVAAFFAFYSEKANEPNVAIYSLVEYYGEGKIGCANEATIVGVGPYVRTHKRHFLQQSDYTYCSKRLPGGKYVYCNHEEVFKRNDDGQDVLTKFIIPRTERSKVLEKLRMMNITAYSLFGSEESLLKTLAYQEIR